MKDVPFVYVTSPSLLNSYFEHCFSVNTTHSCGQSHRYFTKEFQYNHTIVFSVSCFFTVRICHNFMAILHSWIIPHWMDRSHLGSITQLMGTFEWYFNEVPVLPCFPSHAPISGLLSHAPFLYVAISVPPNITFYPPSLLFSFELLIAYQTVRSKSLL